MNLTIYPVPKTCTISKQRFPLAGRLYIKLSDSYSDYLAAAICRFASAASLTITHGRVATAETLLTIRRQGATKHREAYQITSSAEGLLLTGATEEALFRGLASLSQLLNQIDDALPGLTIVDEPDLNARGVMLDVSRCKVPSLETLKKMIDGFASLKYNQLQIYTEHTFAFSNHPLVWANASPYTAQDMLAIKAYCNARYIQLVPNLNCFGHFERWLQHPEYHDYAECPEGFEHPANGKHINYGSTLKPNQQSLRLLDELHGEYLPLFDSAYFNIGGDEPWELGKGWSKSRCDKEGISSVYTDFISRIHQLTCKRNRKMMFWSDIVLQQPDSLKQLPKDLIALNWGYEANHPFHKECRQVAEAQIPFYVCPGTSGWSSLTGRTSNMISNLASAADNAIAFQADGYLVTDWGDNGHHQYLPISYPGFALGACESWNHKASANIDLPHLVNQMYFNERHPTVANIIVQMGAVLDLAPTTFRYRSLFNQIMFWDMQNEYPETLSITDRQLQACRNAFEDLRLQVDGIAIDNTAIDNTAIDNTATADKEILKAELGTAMDMAIHSINRLLYFRGRSKDKAGLRTQLIQIIGQHDRNWLSRNRPGGLTESRGHLMRSFAAIR